jgi:RimJ/RimL family protein N-acetyltransferase
MPAPTARPPLHRDGLVLRALAPGDLDRLLELYTDPDELRWGLPVGVPVPEDHGAMLVKVEESASAWVGRAPGNVAVADEDDPDHLLGVVSWRLDQPVLRIADVGYVVHADARGRGVATRSLRLLTEWLVGALPGADPEAEDAAQDSPRLPRVQLDHSVENLASCAVALRAGFGREGVRRAYLPLRDPAAPEGVRRHDVCLHGLVA